MIYFFRWPVSFFLFMLLLLLLMYQGHCESSFELNQRFHATNSQFIHASILCSDHWKPKETTTKKKENRGECSPTENILNENLS